MKDRYRVRLDGRADRALVGWLDMLLAHLRVLPKGWRAELWLERDPDPPDGVDN